MKCKNWTRDGSGEYCMLISMDHDKDYPHKYYRVFCHGQGMENVDCEIRKRLLKIQPCKER